MMNMQELQEFTYVLLEAKQMEIRRLRGALRWVVEQCQSGSDDEPTTLILGRICDHCERIVNEQEREA